MKFCFDRSGRLCKVLVRGGGTQLVGLAESPVGKVVSGPTEVVAVGKEVMELLSAGPRVSGSCTPSGA